jgi:hypothetical protein
VPCSQVEQKDAIVIINRPQPSATPNPGNIGEYSKQMSKTWLSTPVTTTTKTGKYKKVNQDVVYKNFSYYAQVTDDTEWAYRFNEYSLGKMPKGFSFKMNHDNLGGTLIHKIGTKTNKIDLSSNIDEACSECREFLLKIGIPMTTKDIEKNNRRYQEHFERVNENVPKKWTEIKKIKIRNDMLNKYYNRVAKIMGCNESQKEAIIKTFTIGFMMGQLGSDNVQINGYQITNITGVNYDYANKMVILLNSIKFKASGLRAIKPESSPFTDKLFEMAGYVQYQSVDTTKEAKAIKIDYQSDHTIDLTTCSQYSDMTNLTSQTTTAR